MHHERGRPQAFLASDAHTRILPLMSVSQSIYEVGMYAARPLATVATPLSAKLRRGVAGRRGASERILAWGRARRDSSRPLVWLHAPSVGESLMAQAIIEQLRQQLPEVQMVFTHFSPSAERVSQRVGADVA